MNNNYIEIEKKYLVKTLPEDLESYPHDEYEQGYLSTEPVVRVRREGEDYVLTYKSAGLVSRAEYNLPLTEESYLHLLEKADGIIISKTRYKIPEKDGLTIELDIFHRDLEPLITAEVEFPSEEAAASYTPPGWIGEDVSTDGRFHNSRLSKDGLPDGF